MKLLLWLYSCALATAAALAWISPQLRSKLRLRRHWYRMNADALRRLQHRQGPRLWVHVASAGEFEHIRPVLSRLRDRLPELTTVLSFFSPSGFEAHRTSPLADVVLLLPLDTVRATQRFVQRVRPDVAVFVRYELWPGYLSALRRHGIPTVLVAATFPQSRFWRVPLMRAVLRFALRSFRHILALGTEEAERFRHFEPTLPVTAIPDPRYDRIWEAVQQPKELPLPEPFRNGNRTCLVAGSTWEADHQLLAQAITLFPQELRRQLCLVLVPHELTPAMLAEVEALFPHAQRWSQCTEASPPTAWGEPPVLLVDRFGLLLQLYRFGDAAYVGGGFGRCVHNLAEPAAYGLPLACGPAIAASPDAHRLLSVGALTLVRTADDLAHWLRTVVLNPSERLRHGAAARSVVADRRGGTDQVASILLELLQKRASEP